MSFLLTSPNDQQPKPEQSYFTTVEASLTKLKNADRIDEIVSTLAVSSREELFITQPIARLLRRDWNIVSAKMYVFSLKPDYRALIRADLNEFHYQVNELYKLCSIDTFSDVDTSWLSRLTFEVKIISPLSSSWLRGLKTWDACFARLLTAERLGFIDRKQRIKMLQPVSTAYYGFKTTAMKGQARNSLEMIEEGELM